MNYNRWHILSGLAHTNTGSMSVLASRELYYCGVYGTNRCVVQYSGRSLLTRSRRIVLGGSLRSSFHARTGLSQHSTTSLRGAFHAKIHSYPWRCARPPCRRLRGRWCSIKSRLRAISMVELDGGDPDSYRLSGAKHLHRSRLLELL